MKKRGRPVSKKNALAVRLPSMRGADGVALDNKQAREVLGQIVEALMAACSKGHLSMRDAAVAGNILAQIIDQLPPRRDPRVALDVWSIAMLAAALIDDCNPGEDAAARAAIKTLAPERAQDEDFRDLIGRRCRDVRAGKNRARLQLMPTIHPDVLAMARGDLPK